MAGPTHYGWSAFLKSNAYNIESVLMSPLPMYHFHEDAITGYLQEVSEKIQFRNWICGHYHLNMTVKAKYHILYEQIIKIKG